MTAPAPVPHPPAQVAWPKVFDGIGALVVRCDLDPAALVARIPGLTWIAPKVNGTDITPPADIQHCMDVWRAHGLAVGVWVYCGGPPGSDVDAAMNWIDPTRGRFVIYDVEAEYKRDEGGHYEWAAQLVAEHNDTPIPAAVTSYGGYKSSIDFGAFAKAGWPILAQCYDSFTPGDEDSYFTGVGGPYPVAGIHRLVRSLHLGAGEAVYRPESIDS